MSKKNECILPKTLAIYIEAVVMDYARREAALEGNDISESTRKQYIKFNIAVDMGFAFLEPALKDTMFKDIVSKRGYYSSEASAIICRNAYYKRRARILYNIAIALNMA